MIDFVCLHLFILVCLFTVCLSCFMYFNYFSVENSLLLNHRIAERPELKRTVIIIEFQPPCYRQGANHKTRLPRAIFPSCVRGGTWLLLKMLQSRKAQLHCKFHQICLYCARKFCGVILRVISQTACRATAETVQL